MSKATHPAPTKEVVTKLGLRERQKIHRRKVIIEAARAVIEERGYDAATFHEIADEAEVGVATVYNYFGDKRTLLFSLALSSVQQLDSSLGSWSPKRGHSLEAVMVAWIVEVVSQTLRVLHKSIWAAVIREEFRPDVSAEDYRAIRDRYTGYNRGLLQRLEATGALASEIEIDAVAELLDVISVEVFRRALQLKTGNRQTYRRLAHRLLATVVRGL